MELHWSPVEQRISFTITLIYTYKARNGHVPTYKYDLLSSSRPARPLRSSTQNLLRNLHYNIKSTKVGPLQWPPQARLLNALSLAVKNSNSVDTFKRQPNLFICKLPTCFPILNLLTGVLSFIIVKRPKTINYCYYYYCHYCYY